MRNGWGVFATEIILSHMYICDYGGIEISKEETIIVENSKNPGFLLVVGKGPTSFSLNHTANTKETVGKYINHSSKHPNLFLQIVRSKSINRVKFYSKKVIKIGTQLVYNYGKKYPWLRPCVDTCCPPGKLSSAPLTNKIQVFQDAKIYQNRDSQFFYLQELLFTKKKVAARARLKR